MEEKEELNGSSTTSKPDEAPQNYTVEPNTANLEPYSGSAVPPGPVAPVSHLAPQVEPKKKRGRPRKYGTDGSIVALSPMPISASIPFSSGEYSGWKKSVKKKKKLDFESPGSTTEYSSGGSFTPHMLTVNSGEDITMKIISFSQQGSRAICILSANGMVSNVTFRQPDSCGGTLTYEGRFEILSLQGSFMLNDNGLTKSRTGGMSVSLSGPDGRVLGGGLAGMLVAAGPVQIVVGSFIPGNQPDQKPKKQKYEQTITFGGGAIQANPISEQRYEAASYNAQKPNLATSASFHGDNVTNISFGQASKAAEPENNVYFPDEDSREQSHEVTC